LPIRNIVSRKSERARERERERERKRTGIDYAQFASQKDNGKKKRNERKAGIDVSREKSRGKEKSAGANGISNMFFLSFFFFAS